MRELAESVCDWLAQGHRVACAVVVRTWGSSPRQVGSVMAVRDDGFIAGSVSGGCVEGAVVQAALEVCASGTPRLMVFEGISDQDAWAVGLSCGGTLHVWLVSVPSHDGWVELTAGRAMRWRLRLDPNNPGSEWLPLPTDIPLKEGWFQADYGVRQRLIFVGGSHIAQPLCRLARQLGYWVVVVDPRAAFACPERFGGLADELLCAWPKEAFDGLRIGPDDAVVTLSHDPKIDDPALAIALRAGARYVGALGSRTTQDAKRAWLEREGLGELAMRVRGPVGLSIGAKTPEEIALSIVAELVAVRRGAL